MLLIVRPILEFLKSKVLYLGIARYVLGLWMLPYALSKIFAIQFRSANTMLQVPVASLNGKLLAWLFLGHSIWFEVLLGFLELIPAILLTFRRTTLLGGILMLPMTLNVLIINYAFELWDSTKLIAIAFFTLNRIVLMLEWRKVMSLVQVILQFRSTTKSLMLEVLVNTILLAGAGYYILTMLLRFW